LKSLNLQKNLCCSLYAVSTFYRCLDIFHYLHLEYKYSCSRNDHPFWMKKENCNSLKLTLLVEKELNSNNEQIKIKDLSTCPFQAFYIHTYIHMYIHTYIYIHIHFINLSYSQSSYLM
jgi:hypothetical protein